MSFWLKAIWSEPDNILQHVCCGECWLLYTAVCRHIIISCWCTVVYFTMQAHSVSLTFTTRKQGNIWDARRTKQFNCLCIASKAISDKSGIPSVAPWEANRRWQAKTNRQFCTEQQSGQVDRGGKKSISLSAYPGRRRQGTGQRWQMAPMGSWTGILRKDVSLLLASPIHSATTPPYYVTLWRLWKLPQALRTRFARP